MSYHINIVRLRAVSSALGSWKDKVIFVGGATVSLYASRPLAVSIRPTDDVDVVVELVSLSEFYDLQEHLLKLGFRHDMESNIISRFLLQGLKVDFMPTDPAILGFSNRWYPGGVKTAIECELNNGSSIRIFTPAYFIASKLEAFKTRGNSNLYTSHDLEDIIFVLDHRDTIDEEILNSDTEVNNYLRNEFAALLQNPSFEEALLGHVEQSEQIQRKDRIMLFLKRIAE
jgi:predicted nucleotidyltransferase